MSKFTSAVAARFVSPMSLTLYVSDRATGELRGAIIPHDGRYAIACGYTVGDTSDYVLCRVFKSQKTAMRRAAEILNCDDAVNIAPVL